MPNEMLIHHPPFSCTICPIGRTSIGVRGYTKNPKECKYKCQKGYSFIRNITCQHIYSISVFFFQPTITGKRVYHSYISSAITPPFSMRCECHCFHRIQNWVVQLAQHQTLNLYSKKKPFYKSFFLSRSSSSKKCPTKKKQHIPPPF